MPQLSGEKPSDQANPFQANTKGTGVFIPRGDSKARHRMLQGRAHESRPQSGAALYPATQRSNSAKADLQLHRVPPSAHLGQGSPGTVNSASSSTTHCSRRSGSAYLHESGLCPPLDSLNDNSGNMLCCYATISSSMQGPQLSSTAGLRMSKAGEVVGCSPRSTAPLAMASAFVELRADQVATEYGALSETISISSPIQVYGCNDIESSSSSSSLADVPLRTLSEQLRLLQRQDQLLVLREQNLLSQQQHLLRQLDSASSSIARSTSGSLSVTELFSGQQQHMATLPGGHSCAAHCPGSWPSEPLGTMAGFQAGSPPAAWQAVPAMPAAMALTQQLLVAQQEESKRHAMAMKVAQLAELQALQAALESELLQLL